MLKIRLSRTGKKSQPSFRIVVQEHTAAVKGKFIEALGYYRPATKNKDFKVNFERVKHWFSMGAKPSDTLAVLLKKSGYEGMEKYIAPRDKKRKKKKSEHQSGGEAGAPNKAEVKPKAESKPEAKPAEPTPTPAEAPTPTPAEAPTPTPVEEPTPTPALAPTAEQAPEPAPAKESPKKDA